MRSGNNTVSAAAATPRGTSSPGSGELGLKDDEYQPILEDPAVGPHRSRSWRMYSLDVERTLAPTVPKLHRGTSVRRHGGDAGLEAAGIGERPAGVPVTIATLGGPPFTLEVAQPPVPSSSRTRAPHPVSAAIVRGTSWRWARAPSAPSWNSCASAPPHAPPLHGAGSSTDGAWHRRLPEILLGVAQHRRREPSLFDASYCGGNPCGNRPGRWGAPQRGSATRVRVGTGKQDHPVSAR